MFLIYIGFMRIRTQPFIWMPIRIGILFMAFEMKAKLVNKDAPDIRLARYPAFYIRYDDKSEVIKKARYSTKYADRSFTKTSETFFFIENANVQLFKVEEKN